MDDEDISEAQTVDYAIESIGQDLEAMREQLRILIEFPNTEAQLRVTLASALAKLDEADAILAERA